MLYHHASLKPEGKRYGYFSLIPLAFDRYKSLHLLKDAVGTEPYKVSKILKGFNKYIKSGTLFLAFIFLLTDALPIFNLTKTVFGADAGNAGASGPIPPTSSSGTFPLLNFISIQGYVVSLVYLDYPGDLSILGNETVIGSTLVNGSTQKDGVKLTDTSTYMIEDELTFIPRPVTKIDIIKNQKPRLIPITNSMLAGGGQTIDDFYKLPSQGNGNSKTLFTSHYINGSDDVLNINAEPKLSFIRVLSWLTGESISYTKIDIIKNQKPRLIPITNSMLAGGGQTIDDFYKLPSQGNGNSKTLFTSHYINGSDDVLNINAEPKLSFIRVLSWLTGESISYRLKNGKTLDSHAATSPAPGIPKKPSQTVIDIDPNTTYAQLVAEGKLAFHVEPMIQIKDVGSRKYNTLSASMVYHHSKSIKNRNNYFSLIPLAFDRYKSLHLLKDAVGTEPYKVSKILKGFNKYIKSGTLASHSVDGVYLNNLPKREEYLKYMAGIGIIKLRPEPSYTTEGDFEFALPPSDFEIFELAANPIELPNGNKGFIDLETGKMSLTVKGGYNGNPKGYKDNGTNEDNNTIHYI